MSDTTHTLTGVNMIDADGLWITAMDENGQEVELTIRGLTPDRMAAWLAGTPVHSTGWVDGKPQYNV